MLVMMVMGFEVPSFPIRFRSRLSSVMVLLREIAAAPGGDDGDDDGDATAKININIYIPSSPMWLPSRPSLVIVVLIAILAAPSSWVLKSSNTR